MSDTLLSLREKILQLVEEFAEEKYASKAFKPFQDHVPVSGKLIGAEELTNMVDASLDGWLTTGRFNELFEKRLAELFNLDFAMSVNSGSSANLVAFSTLTSEKLGSRKIHKGDEVISVAAGFPTTVNPIIQFGAVPVFVDVDINTHNIDVSLIEDAITEKTKAIMIAHALGNPFDAVKVKEICDKHNLWLIEDCCDAFGAKIEGKNVGTFGDLATLSFYPAHHITMGEGGAVLTNSPELKQIAESFRDWGRDCYCKPGEDNTCNKRFCWKLGDLPYGYDHKYIYSHLGYNLKISDMQAACGLAQLGKVEGFIETRNKNFAYLNERLKSCKEFIDLPTPTEGSEPSWFGFPFVVKKHDVFDRNGLVDHLSAKNIGTRLLFAGDLTKQPYMKNQKYRVAGELHNTQIVLHQTVWVGVHPALTQEHLEFIAEAVEEYFGVSDW